MIKILLKLFTTTLNRITASNHYAFSTPVILFPGLNDQLQHTLINMVRNEKKNRKSVAVFEKENNLTLLSQTSSMHALTSPLYIYNALTKNTNQHAVHS